ncbi:S8 family serine peptidase [Pontibacillus salipaludis]|uniref:S8 family serine peptidase n=1 Tax=Pontibacillus salipaludis TaxID=1697394 RepID=UPI0031EB6529
MKRVVVVLMLAGLFMMNIPGEIALGKRELESIIIEVEDDAHKWKEYIEKYHPRVEVIQVYDTLLQGLALKGTVRDLERVEKSDFVEQSFPEQTYQVHINESVPFVLEDKDPFRSTSYTGKGVKVGVIDTGIDYTHPDLKKNYKGGYDVVDLDEDPMETLETQGEPTLHGSHVAGIIAADGKLKGMAPDAELYGYRALGPGGIGSSVQVIAAIEQAVEDGMDIINLSLGSSVNGPDWPTSIAVNQAVDMGVAMVISNGNSGPGEWTVGSPATAVKSIAVGASTPPIQIPYLYDSLSRKAIPVAPMMGSVPWDLRKTYSIASAGLGIQISNNLRGKIALLERGEITFTEKAMMAQKAGAVAALIYNNEDGKLQGAIEGEVTIPVASLTKQQGKWLKKKIADTNNWLDTKYQTHEDTIASFSSKGPVTWNWDIKPDIVAPGVAISSTVPGGYKDLQGTSMAAPHVAGALALLKEAHPDWGPDKLKAALLSTATVLKEENGENVQPISQGMGRIEPLEAIKPSSILYNGRLAFGRILDDTETRETTITVENASDETQDYRFTIPKQEQGVRFQLPMSFALQPGEKKTVPISLSIHQRNLQLDESFVQGWLELKDNHKTYQLPYLALTKKAEFPRAMGLEFTLKPFSDEEYQYKLYLPLAADVLEVDLYDPETLRYIRPLFKNEDVERGVVEGTLTEKEVGQDGTYLAVVTVKKDGVTQSFETPITIGQTFP